MNHEVHNKDVGGEEDPKFRRDSEWRWSWDKTTFMRDLGGSKGMSKWAWIPDRGDEL
jgi:hypothetical protein